MSLIKDTYTPKQHLPVHVSYDGMQLLETTLKTEKSNDTLFVEIGDDVTSTPENIRSLLQAFFPNLLEQAIEDQCEFIQFYV